MVIAKLLAASWLAGQQSQLQKVSSPRTGRRSSLAQGHPQQALPTKLEPPHPLQADPACAKLGTGVTTCHIMYIAGEEGGTANTGKVQGPGRSARPPGAGEWAPQLPPAPVCCRPQQALHHG